jgi:two-component system cell cycle response regulator DivK
MSPGLELIEALKADPTLRPIPVLAVTAYAGKGDEERIREAGAEGYLAKPVSIGPFMQAVMKLVSPWPETTVPGQKPGRTGNATR